MSRSKQQAVGPRPTFVATVLLVTALLAGCANTADSKGEVETRCQSPRPEVCTQQYDPVCGLRASAGDWQTYSNGCVACTDTDVIGYRDGACPAGKKRGSLATGTI